MTKEKNTSVEYYNEITSKLFLSASVIMTLSLPFLVKSIPNPVIIPLFSIIVIATFAGITYTPQRKWVEVANVFISAVSLSVFEYVAIITYSRVGDGLDSFFLINQGLAVLFLFAFYTSLHVVVRKFYLNHEN